MEFALTNTCLSGTSLPFGLHPNQQTSTLRCHLNSNFRCDFTLWHLYLKVPLIYMLCTCVTQSSHSLNRVPRKQHASLMCLPVFTTVYGTARSSDCHSYLHCKYGKQCSGRDLKITPPRASVTKLINGGMGAERVLTMQVSLSSHPFLLSPAVLFSPPSLSTVA